MSSKEQAIQRPDQSTGIAAAGLPDAPARADETLRVAGIDPDRLGIRYLGRPLAGARAIYWPWARRLSIGFLLWAAVYLLDSIGRPLAALGESQRVA